MKITIYDSRKGRIVRHSTREWKFSVGSVGTVFCPVIPDGVKRVDRGVNCVPCRMSEYSLLQQVKYLYAPKTERTMGRQGWLRLYRKFRTVWDKPAWAEFSHLQEMQDGKEQIPGHFLRGENGKTALPLS